MAGEQVRADTASVILWLLHPSALLLAPLLHAPYSILELEPELELELLLPHALC